MRKPHRGLALTAYVLLYSFGCNAVAGIDEPIEVPGAEAGPDSGGGGSDSDASPNVGADREAGGSGCTESNVTFTDPNTGVAWSPVWYCNNAAGASLFEAANHLTPIGVMTTVFSWFVCYRHGEMHRGGNDVWYYTQGDLPAPGWEARKAWGYMPAFSVFAGSDPFPGIVECTVNP